MVEPSSSGNGNTPLSARQQQLTRQVLALLGPEAASRYSEGLMGLVLARGRATLDVQLAFPDSDDDEDQEEARIHADLAVGYKVEAYACMDQVRFFGAGNVGVGVGGMSVLLMLKEGGLAGCLVDRWIGLD